MNVVSILEEKRKLIIKIIEAKEKSKNSEVEDYVEKVW